ncbi:hypothetical protein ACFL6U_20195 [Planctomycetota bacterium]
MVATRTVFWFFSQRLLPVSLLMGAVLMSYGQTAVLGRTVFISDDMTVSGVIRIPDANDSQDDWIQTAGRVSVEEVWVGFGDRGSYALSGGLLVCSNDLNIGSNGLFVINGRGSSIRTSKMKIDAQAHLEFYLDALGVTAVQVSRFLQLNPACHVIVDGTDYEGLDGYFPLIKTSRVSGSIDVNNVTLIGFEGREPALVQETSGLWLRLIAPPSLSERLCSLVPDSTVATDYANTSFSASRAFVPSGSTWSLSLNEGHVMDTWLSHTVIGTDANNCSWDLRTGRGGFVYSLRTPALGETVPPSYRSSGDTSPWNDEVWQGVAVDTSQNDTSNGNPYFLHQSGVYLKDPALMKPFYSPQVASCLDVAERSFTTINWPPQAHINIYVDDNPNNDQKSYLLMFTRYRDLGQGVIEVSLGYYNYGPDTLDFLNMPWGGVRRTSTEYVFLSEPGGAHWSGPITNSFGNSLLVHYDNTGGWVGFSATANGVTPTMGLVYGLDHDTPLPQQRRSYSTFRCGYAGGAYKPDETAWRNYFVTSNIRWYTLKQGNGLWSRHYFVLGENLQDLAERIAARDLVDAQLRAFDYNESSTPLVAYRFIGSGSGFQIQEDDRSPDLLLYAHPVRDSFPIFEVFENDDSRYLTWNPYANGIVKPYDGTIAGLRLLGFALRGEDVNREGTNYTYESLEDVLSKVLVNYRADGEDLSVRVGRGRLR